MNVTKISYSRTFVLHKAGEHETISLDAELAPGDNPGQSLIELKNVVEEANAGTHIAAPVPGPGFIVEMGLRPAEEKEEPQDPAPVEIPMLSPSKVLLKGFETCATREDLAILAAPHGELIAQDPELKAAYDRKLAELAPGTLAAKEEKPKRKKRETPVAAADAQQDPPPAEGYKPPYEPEDPPAVKEEKLNQAMQGVLEEAKAENAAEPATETAPPFAAPAATQQTLEWFTARVGRTVWMQGADETKYSGCYLIETQDYPAYMIQYQETEGFTFRDATPEEITAYVEAQSEAAATA